MEKKPTFLHSTPNLTNGSRRSLDDWHHQSKGKLEKILKLPAEMDLAALKPVDYPAEHPPLKEGNPVKKVCEFLK